MAGVAGRPGTLGDVLASRRRRSFVGRSAEVELVAEAGMTVVRLDGRDVSPSAPDVLAVLGGVLDVPAGEGAITGPRERVVVLLDTYERLAPLDDRVRTRLLPRLLATALTVLAGRMPPSPAWRADAAWRDLLRVVVLRNFSPEESRTYLRVGDVDPALHERMLDLTHGHPLGLSLLADVACRGGEVGRDSLSPDLVGTLLRQFVEVLPSALHRGALEVCALARVTTEALLRDALELDDAHEVFAWLRELSFVEAGPDGLFPHGLARDALDADLRWRDVEGYTRVFRGVRAHVHGCLESATGHAQQRAIFDEKYVFRRLPGIASPVDWDSWGRFYPEPARAEDRESILDLVLAGEGAAWDFVRRHAPTRPGQAVTQTRFVIDGETYQGPSPTLNAAPILTTQQYLGTPNLSWDFRTLAEPDRWDEYFAVADLPRAAGADFTVGGRRYGLFAHDFRQVPVDAWLELLGERAIAHNVALASAAQPSPPLVLSQPEFDEAVRRALRDLSRPSCWRATCCCGPDCCATAPGTASRSPSPSTACCARPYRRWPITPVTTSCCGLSTAPTCTPLRPRKRQRRPSGCLSFPPGKGCDDGTDR